MAGLRSSKRLQGGGGRRHLLRTMLTITLVGLSGGVEPAFALGPCTSTTYCKDECYQLDQDGWTVSSTSSEEPIPVASAKTANVSYNQARRRCTAGRVRVRRFDANGNMQIRCVNLEGCGTDAKALRICSSMGTDGFLAYKCAKCTGTVDDTGNCN